MVEMVTTRFVAMVAMVEMVVETTEANSKKNVNSGINNMLYETCVTKSVVEMVTSSFGRTGFGGKMVTKCFGRNDPNVGRNERSL